MQERRDPRSEAADTPAPAITRRIFYVDPDRSTSAAEVTDLRSAMDLLRSMPGELVTTGRLVDPYLEIAGIYKRIGAGTPARPPTRVGPALFKSEPIPGGPAKGHMIPQEDLDLMLDEYYAARGWSPDGVPTRAKLEELRLGYAADQLGLA